MNIEATIAALALLKAARIECVDGPLCAWEIVHHAYRKLNNELGAYLKGETE